MKDTVRSTATLSSNLTELDNLLAELSSSPLAVSATDRQPASCMYRSVFSFFLSSIVSVNLMMRYMYKDMYLFF